MTPSVEILGAFTPFWRRLLRGVAEYVVVGAETADAHPVLPAETGEHRRAGRGAVVAPRASAWAYPDDPPPELNDFKLREPIGCSRNGWLRAPLDR